MQSQRGLAEGRQPKRFHCSNNFRCIGGIDDGEKPKTQKGNNPGAATRGGGAGGQGFLQRHFGRDRADAEGLHDDMIDAYLARPKGKGQVPRGGGCSSDARLGRAVHRDHAQVRPARLYRDLPEPAFPGGQRHRRGQLRRRARGRWNVGCQRYGRYRRRHPASPRHRATSTAKWGSSATAPEAGRSTWPPAR